MVVLSIRRDGCIRLRGLIMKLPNIPTPYLIAGGALLLLVGYVYFRGAKGVASDAAGAVVNVGAGLIEGTVQSVIDVTGVGVDDAACELACANGDTFGAFANCNQTRFFQYVQDGK